MSMDDCVQRLLSKKLNKGEKPSKQDLAIVHSECEKIGSKNKIAQLNIHTKLLSAKLQSIKIGKLLESKKNIIKEGQLVNDFEVEPEKKSKHASYFLIKDDTNGNDWGVTTPSIPKHIESFIGNPFVITSTDFVEGSPYKRAYMHPNMLHFRKIPEMIKGLDPDNLDDVLEFQKPWRVGDIVDVVHDRKKQGWFAQIDILEKFQGKPLPIFSSPTIRQNDMSEPDDKISDWIGINLTGLDERPAFGPVALLGGTCNDTKSQCKRKLFNDFSILMTESELSKIKFGALLSVDNTDVNVVSVFDKRKKKERKS